MSTRGISHLQMVRRFAERGDEGAATKLGPRRFARITHHLDSWSEKACPACVANRVMTGARHDECAGKRLAHNLSATRRAHRCTSSDHIFCDPLARCAAGF